VLRQSVTFIPTLSNSKEAILVRKSGVSARRPLLSVIGRKADAVYASRDFAL